MRAALRRWRQAASPSFAGESCTSPFRQANQDRIVMHERLVAVADGMGGHAHGGEAAESVVTALAALSAPDEAGVRDALLACDEMLRGSGDEISGATTAVLIWDDARYTCLWAGDCRIYRWRDGALEQLTHDHRLVQQLIDGGALSVAEARGHPHGSVVTSAIGAGNCTIASRSGALAPGDRFLVCSDGLSDALGEDALAACVGKASPEAAVAALHAAAAPYARDDVSVIIVDR